LNLARTFGISNVIKYLNGITIISILRGELMLKPQKLSILVLFLAAIGLFFFTAPAFAAEETPAEPTTDSEGDEEKPEEPLTLESLKKQLDEMKKKQEEMKKNQEEDGTQAPDSMSMKFTGSVRTRHERRENVDFTFRIDDRYDFTLLRSRLGIDAKVTDMVGCFLEMEDSRYFGQPIDPLYAPLHEADTLDLYQGYVSLLMPWGKKASKQDEETGFFIGRQEIMLGDERMVGNFEWSNVGRTFDAVRFRYNGKKHYFDTWYATMDENFDRRSNDTEFAGAYYSYRGAKDQEVDFYFMHRRDGDRTTESELTITLNSLPGPPVVPPDLSNLIVETLGTRADGQVKGQGVSFLYNAELIYQWGHWGPDRMKAWAVATKLGLCIDNATWTPAFYFVYNRASGDSDPFDMIHETVHTPYPTNHKHYGLMDFFSWRNMRQIGFVFRLTPFKDKKSNKEMYFEAAYYTFHLDESIDAWYSSSGAVIAKAFVGEPHINTHVGEELDFLFMWKMAKHSHISAGFSIFYPRDYVRRFVLGGHPDNSIWAFVEFLVKF